MADPVYFILGSPGSYIHYVGCLVKLIHDASIINSIEKTNDFGHYDDIFSHHTMMDYSADSSIEETLASIKQAHDENVFLLHISDHSDIELILTEFPNAKIIFISQTIEDRPKIITNLLVKFYLKGLVDPNTSVGFSALYLMKKYKKDISLLNKEKLTSINRQNHPYLLEIYNFISAYTKHQFKLYSTMPIDDARVQEIKFSDIAGDAVISKLEKITAQQNNAAVKEFSSYFKTNQPNFSTIQNLIDKIKTSPWADVVYNHAIPKFEKANSNQSRWELWQQCQRLYDDYLKIYADK